MRLAQAERAHAQTLKNLGELLVEIFNRRGKSPDRAHRSEVAAMLHDLGLDDEELLERVDSKERNR